MMPTQDENQTLMLEQLTAAFTAIPFNQMLGLRLDELNEKHVLMSFDMEKQLIGNFVFGILHGGVISSVLDMAGGMMAMGHSIFKDKDVSMEEFRDIITKCSTIDLHVNYLRPGKGKHFFAKAWLDKSGKHITFARMELHNDANTLIASASGTYLLVH